MQCGTVDLLGTASLGTVKLPVGRVDTYEPIDLPYFSPQEDRDSLLSKIDRIWRSEDLFNGEIRLENYIADLESYLRLTKGEDLKIPRDKRNLFIDKILSLDFHPDLSLLEKAILMTQALELALLGIDTTSVLERIENNRIKRSPKYQDNTLGHREEVLAGWYFAKFIYPKGKTINQSIEMLSCSFDGKKANKRKEVDIATEDSLVSVKIDRHASIAKQITDLFFILLFSPQRSQIKKIILIQGGFSENEQKSFKSKTSSIITSAQKQIFEGLNCPRIHEKLFNDLQIEFYFIPQANNPIQIRAWIKEQYEKSNPNERTQAHSVFPGIRPHWIVCQPGYTKVAC